MQPLVEQAKERALRLLARRDHSAQELKTKLRQKLKIDDSVLAEVLAYLKESGYLAPEGDLAERWVQHWRAEGRGRFWINGKLRTKGLPPVAWTDEEEVEVAREYFDKKLGTRNFKEMNQKEKAKLARSLISRGFSPSTVTTVIKGL